MIRTYNITPYKKKIELRSFSQLNLLLKKLNLCATATYQVPIGLTTDGHKNLAHMPLSSPIF